MVDEIDAELDRIVNLVKDCREANVHVEATREQVLRAAELLEELNRLRRNGLHVGFEEQVDEAREWIATRILKLVPLVPK